MGSFVLLGKNGIPSLLNTNVSNGTVLSGIEFRHQHLRSRPVNVPHVLVNA